ncbi:DUF4097 domain-containing protein [Candidatus Aminicenantes bacterium AC-334-K16]|jgi:DUF4097 and DUF4098 domain-containing protein YvlB|nr:DUF4097 domain-containing protein [Candidatus Aminicenantes bacterium AC-334-K16]
MRQKRKLLSLVLTLGFVGFILGFFLASPVLAKEKYEERFQKSVSLSRTGKVEISNVSGDIEVSVWEKNEVKIDAVKVSRASSLEKAKENAARVKIEVEKEGNILSIATRYPKKTFKSLNVSVNYKLTIPDKASLRVKSVSGDVNCGQIGGFLKISAVSGDVVVEQAGDGLELSSVSGNVEVSRIEGEAELKTVSGDISIAYLRGSVDAESVSGSIDLKDVSQARRVKLSSLSGDVRYQGDLNPDGIYTLKTHSGDLEIRLPAETKFDVVAKTFSGKIDSEFEITLVGKLSRRELRGKVNGGGAELELKTFSGGIKLRRK